MTDWKQIVGEHIQHLPFMLATRNGIDHRKMDLVRIAESVIIAGLTALVTMYGVTKRMEGELTLLQQQNSWQWAEVVRQVDRIEQLVREERKERVESDKELSRKVDSMANGGSRQR